MQQTNHPHIYHFSHPFFVHFQHLSLSLSPIRNFLIYFLYIFVFAFSLCVSLSLTPLAWSVQRHEARKINIRSDLKTEPPPYHHLQRFPCSNNMCSLESRLTCKVNLLEQITSVRDVHVLYFICNVPLGLIIYSKCSAVIKGMQHSNSKTVFKRHQL